ncbi:MAG: alpha/beta fold hydrolase [Candidatus Zixiibacteriota bacterium]|nr:MAG: alpha/beta fold hydrolase [candidate division Zixibacteria bacterium]
MRKSFFLFSLLLLWLGGMVAAQQTSVTTRIHGNEITMTTTDGLELHAWLTESPVGKAPLFVLLPMMGHTHTSYNPFIKALYERFKTKDSTRTLQTLPHILSLDLRGHGASTRLQSATISRQEMEPEDFAHYPSDVAAMIEKVAAENEAAIDRNYIVIIGASIGANTAIMAAEQVSGVRQVVMLSPGESYRGLEPAASLVNFSGQALILAAKEDSYSRTSSEKLAGLNKKLATLKIYEGSYHGTDLIDADKHAMKDLLDWLVK